MDTRKKTKLDKADVFLKHNFWKAIKLAVATIAAVALFGALMTSANFAIMHLKRLQQTIKS